jgi:small subunit ribosomal protein S6
MPRYETLFLASTEITEDEISFIERYLDEQLSKVKGELSVFDKWGKYRLAYPVGKSDYGVYILARYEIGDDAGVANFVKELDSFVKVKCDEFVLRYVSVRLSKNAPATYIKPDPIDAGRTASVDKFVKENKMEGLLGRDFEARDGDASELEAKEESHDA